MIVYRLKNELWAPLKGYKVIVTNRTGRLGHLCKGIDNGITNYIGSLRKGRGKDYYYCLDCKWSIHTRSIYNIWQCPRTINKTWNKARVDKARLVAWEGITRKHERTILKLAMMGK